MTKLLSAMATMAFVVGFAFVDDPAAKAGKDGGGNTGKNADAAKLVGTYTISSGEKDGKALPKEHFEGSLVKITDKTVVGTDKDKKEFYSATYTLDTSKTPWVITMTEAKKQEKKDDKDGKEEKKDVQTGRADKPAEAASATGLVMVDGDTLTIIYALPGGKMPTEFKTGDKQQMFVMKRVEDKKAK